MQSQRRCPLRKNYPLDAFVHNLTHLSRFFTALAKGTSVKEVSQDHGYRSHLWKAELQKLSNQEKLHISVCHFPPGTSKWNKIEHKLFSFVTMNWRGKPLTSYRTIVKLIAATTTKSGLTVKVRLDKKKYKKGIEVPKDVLENLTILKNEFHGEWNYTILPNRK